MSVSAPWHGFNDNDYNTTHEKQMATTKDTRVKVPADTRTLTKTRSMRAQIRSSPMTPGASSPYGNGPRPIRGSVLGNIPTMDMWMSMNITTWNVLTMSHPGY